MAKRVQANKFQALSPRPRRKKDAVVPDMSAQTSASSTSQASAVDAGASPFTIVAIGASAGGLEALEQFLGHVPAGSGMAFVVIQHLDPNYKGMMPELLQRATVMPVAQAKDRQKVKPDSVYVIPPNKDLSILHDTLYLLDPVAPRGLRLPIDFFFRSLADDRRERAVGVILSGMGSDGTLGLRAIKDHGGLLLVQDPAEAKFDGMPRSAIETGLIDIVAPAAALPQRISDTLRLVPRIAQGLAKVDAESSEQKSSFDRICILLRGQTGHDFSSYKKTTVYRRIERRMAIHQIDRIAHYVRFLRENPQEIDLLFKELLIGVTNFFRDPLIWDYLAEQVLPELLAAYTDGAALRAWVAGCSTGEEAYTLAMTFCEVVERLKLPSHCTLQIFATDLDPDAIDKARQGFYPANIAADVTAVRLGRFFTEDGGGFRIGREIREMVIFAPQNLIMDPPFTKLDILTCRNLLIYLGPELQEKLLPLFYYSLKPGGILLLGSAESVGAHTDLFATVESKARLFRRKEGSLRALDMQFPTRKNLVVRNKPTVESNSVPAIVNLQTLADQLLLQQFAPAAVLISPAGDILYISGRTGKYLEPAAGKVNWNIHAMAREGLRHELAVVLPKALRSGVAVISRNLRVGTNGGTQIVDLTVQPIDNPVALRGMAMVVFADAGAATDATLPSEPLATPGKRAPRRGQRETEMEQGILHLQQELQALREEMQSSQEELKSANEELQSANEELQSANEELTTSKEEMQSLNEELQTVNAELQIKLDDLSTANNDMKNLLNSTDIATVFLDNAMRVRRFTDQSTRLFKLIPGDIGRPLSDIVTDLAYPGLLNDAHEVLRTLTFAETEITTNDGRWFQVKIMPYRTLTNVIDGVVITLTDISRAKHLEAKLRALSS
jgi:chemotaxis methyl-accepting protein methylase/PAS domain-containing protein